MSHSDTRKARHTHTEAYPKIKGLQNDSVSLGIGSTFQQGENLNQTPSMTRLHSMVDEEQLQKMNAQMLENTLLQHQTRTELLQTKLDAAMEENRQLRLMMAEERQVALDRYQALRRMIVQHLDQCPQQEKSENESLPEFTSTRPFVTPQPSYENNEPFARPSSPSIESTDSFGIPESSYETTNPFESAHNHVETKMVTPSEARRINKTPEELPTASHLLLSLSEYQGEAHKSVDYSNSQAHEDQSGRDEIMDHGDPRGHWSSPQVPKCPPENIQPGVPSEIQIETLHLEKES